MQNLRQRSQRSRGGGGARVEHGAPGRLMRTIWSQEEVTKEASQALQSGEGEVGHRARAVGEEEVDSEADEKANNQRPRGW